MTQSTEQIAVQHSKPPFKLPKPKLLSHQPWDDDALDRKKTADLLTNLVRVETNPLVVTLNGSWGTGKTFFLERWKEQLRLDGLNAIYFNAWEEDYSNDPLVAIVGQLKDELTDGLYREAIQAVVGATKRVAGRAVRNLVKLATADVIEIESDDISTDRDRLFEEYDKVRESRIELGTALGKLTSKVYDNSKGPLIFIVDELDRCRPTFAIELLERIKHLFGIANLVFVLGIDREQLGSSIRSVYGDIEVDGYLRRFFDMEFSLRPANSGTFCEVMLKKFGIDTYAQVLDGKFKGNSYQNAHQTVESVLPFLCRKLAFSLRDVESLVRSYVFVLRNEKNSQNNWPVLLSLLLVLRLKNSSLYSRFTQGKAGAKEVLDYIEAGYGLIDSDSENDDFLRANWIAVTTYSCQPESYMYSRETSNELKTLQNSGNVSPHLYNYLSSRTVRLSLEEKDRFFKLREAEHTQRTMSTASTKRAIESVLGVVEI